MTTDPPGAVLPPLGTVPGVIDARLSPVGGRPAALPVQAPVEHSSAAGNTPAAAGLPPVTPAAAGDHKLSPGPAGEATGPEGQTALEWLETTTAHIWRMWGQRYRDGKDW